MKKYKFLVPILLVAVFLLSFYSFFDAKVAEANQYNTALSSARNFRQQGIAVDAMSNYMTAVELRPSPEIYLEIGEYYIEMNQSRSAIEWGETFLEVYPKKAEPYEFLMDLYLKMKDYVACFDLADVFTKRELESARISEILNEIAYEFYFTGEYDDVGMYSQSLCPIMVGNKWGYASLSGGVSIGARFSKVGTFVNGLAPVVDAKGDAYFIDAQGNKKRVVLGVENVVELGSISNNIYALYDGTCWAFYDQSNTRVFGDYDAVSAISNGIIAVENEGRWSLININGEKLINQTYDAVAMNENSVVYMNNRLFVYNGSHYEMIDAAGTVHSKHEYEDVRIFNDATYAAVKIDGKWGFIDASGELKIDAKYEDARSFSYGYAAVKVDGLWGYIDKNENFVIAPQFLDAKDFNGNGTALVDSGRYWTLLKLYKYNH